MTKKGVEETISIQKLLTFLHSSWGQAGTWDPLLQCLHLDKRLLKQQNTKKLQGTKNNRVHVQLGQIMDNKIQNDPKNP